MTAPAEIIPQVIAFFPWVGLEEPIELGPLRLIPYERGELPGNLPHVTQDQLDKILAAYSSIPGHLIHRGMLMEYGDWQLGQPLPNELVSRLFQMRNIISISAISKWQPFSRFNYPNYSGYELVIQRYTDTQIGNFAFSTRRREGGVTHMWHTDLYTFGKPREVDGNLKTDLDMPLLEALLKVPHESKHIFEALEEFNCASTDSHLIPEHVELVMCQTALEWLLQVDHRAKSLASKMVELVTEFPQKARWIKKGQTEPEPWPLSAAWCKKWPADGHLLAAWAKDFVALRGSSAHGAEDARTVWDARRHLLFLSQLFPLLLKWQLLKLGLYTLTSRDKMNFTLFNYYLGRDPFEPSEAGSSEDYPGWRDIRTCLITAGR